MVASAAAALGDVTVQGATTASLGAGTSTGTVRVLGPAASLGSATAAGDVFVTATTGTATVTGAVTAGDDIEVTATTGSVTAGTGAQFVGGLTGTNWVSITRAYALTLQRAPDKAEHAKLVAHARKHGLTSACRVLFNSNEFMFVD